MDYNRKLKREIARSIKLSQGHESADNKLNIKGLKEKKKAANRKANKAARKQRKK
jgi:predicted FMN-binding regulatory protein PaiB